MIKTRIKAALKAFIYPAVIQRPPPPPPHVFPKPAPEPRLVLDNQLLAGKNCGCGSAPGWVVEDEHGQPLRHEYTPLHGCSIAPRYIGRAAVYLAADYLSAFTTGTVLNLDGGISLYNHRVAQEPPVPTPAGG